MAAFCLQAGANESLDAELRVLVLNLLAFIIR
jgi:hypothetical protein